MIIDTESTVVCPFFGNHSIFQVITSKDSSVPNDKSPKLWADIVEHAITIINV